MFTVSAIGERKTLEITHLPNDRSLVLIRTSGDATPVQITVNSLWLRQAMELGVCKREGQRSERQESAIETFNRISETNNDIVQRSANLPTQRSREGNSETEG